MTPSNRSAPLTIASAFFSLLLTVVPALAGDPTPPPAPANPEESALVRYFSQDYMLGTWGGRRTELAKNGVDFELFYIGSLPSNISGGIKTGTVYQHALLFAIDFDTAKLGLWEGGRLHASGVWLEGDPFSRTYVGDTNKSNLVDLEADARVWEFYYQQNLFNDKLTIKAGIMSVDRDFVVPELYNSLASINFLNQTFFFPTLAFNLYPIPGFPASHHSLPTVPYGALGVLVKWQVTDTVYAQAAMYEGSPDFSPSGTRISLNDDEGSLFYAEIGYRRNQGKNDTGLPGNFKLTGYYHNDDFSNIYDTVGSLFGFAQATTHHGNYGGFFLAEQMLFFEKNKQDPAQQGLIAFGRLSAAPPDRNIAQFGADVGFVYKGPIPGRDWDTIGIAGSYLQMSKDLKRAQRAANNVVPGFFVVSDYEAAVELNYKLQMAAWWTLQSSLQYVMHPAGSATVPNSWFFGIQTTLRF
jgi:porin